MTKAKASSSAREGAGRQQRAAQGRGAGAAPQGAKGGRGQEGRAHQGRNGAQQTGTPDEHYNLVSVLYHALKGAQTYAQYAQDAEEGGDVELREFFEDMQSAERTRAHTAKKLLATRLGRGLEGEEHDE